MRATGISLWLVPEPAARERLAATIALLARRLGAPAFEPHVTLIGSLAQPLAEIVGSAERLAAATAPLVLRVLRVGDRPEYFRCLFLEIAADAALAELQLRARGAFSQLPGRPFSPHLSVVYGDLDEATRRGLVAELSGASVEAFEAGELRIVRTEGEVQDWRPLATFALSRRD